MFSKDNLKKLLCVVLATTTMLAFAACDSREEETPDSSDTSTSQSSSSSSVDDNDDTSEDSSEPIGDNVEDPTVDSGEDDPRPEPSISPEMTTLEKIEAAYKVNDDVKGWIEIPNTEIDNEILQSGDNIYYERRDITKTYNYYGSYFLDAGNVLTNRASLTANTIIYGHNMDDDPNGDKFAQLMKYRDQTFATNNPYIYVTTTEGELVFEVFSAFFTDIGFQYHLEKPDAATLQYIIDGGRARSEYDYNVNVTTSDKILTLSTCTYVYGEWQADEDYNKAQRYVVQARLVPEGEALKTTASITKNPDPLQPSFGDFYSDAKLAEWGISQYK